MLRIDIGPFPLAERYWLEGLGLVVPAICGRPGRVHVVPERGALYRVVDMDAVRLSMLLIVLSAAASYVRDRLEACGWIARYALISRPVIIEPGIGSGTQSPV